MRIPGVKDADVRIVWEPPWSPERMSPEARKKLGFPV
jgi:metal-sulfur cluster biosynthetic enzyme